MKQRKKATKSMFQNCPFPRSLYFSIYLQSTLSYARQLIVSDVSSFLAQERYMNWVCVLMRLHACSLFEQGKSSRIRIPV